MCHPACVTSPRCQLRIDQDGAMRKLGIFGAGGFAREIMILLEDLGLAERVNAFFESANIWRARNLWNIPVVPIEQFEVADSDLILAVGSPEARKVMHASVPKETYFPTLVHPHVRRSSSVEIGEGSIICAGSILTCDIRLGRHVNIDRMTNVGHDCILGDFTTTAPGVILSGNCEIGEGCYLGTHCSVREKTIIAPGTTVGMGAVVVSSIAHPGVYVGNPARLLSSQ
jgi:sugar O-acyltransferase (sialic acid O-acetyltransferase NeuD family)